MIQKINEEDGTVTLIFGEGQVTSVINLDKNTKRELLRILIEEEIKDL